MDLLYPLLTLSFAYPWALLFPVVVIALAYLNRKGRSNRINYPNVELLRETKPALRTYLRPAVLRPLALAAIVFLGIASARPQKVTLVNDAKQARNIVLTIDLSRSMSADDIQTTSGQIDRLSAVKRVATDFVESRKQDRIGLVVFGEAAYLQAPLTMDHDLLKSMLKSLSVGIAGDGTAIGDGLGLSLKRLRDIANGSKAIVLVTDGSNNAGRISPIKAAQVAARLGIKIHTIGIGSATPVTVRAPGDFFFDRVQKQVEFDEAMLKKIAETTNGVYFNASSLAALESVYHEIDKLEQTIGKDERSRKVSELFVPYALLSLLCYLAYLAFAKTIFLRVP